MSALYDPARAVGEPIGSRRDVAVSSIPFVPDRLEPLAVFGFAVLLRFPLLRFATPAAYGYSQHSIGRMVKTLSGLGAAELQELAPGLSIAPDGQSLSGPWVPEWAALAQAIEASPELRAALESGEFNDALELSAAQLRREQTVALEDAVAFFGSDAPDFMAGANGADLLRGGAGADILFADEGADRLIGGAGDDFLIGAAGPDTYLFARGDGADTVMDADGGGALIRDGAKLALGIRAFDGLWVDPRAGITYARSDADLVVTFPDAASDRITIKDFDFARAQAEGFLGIRLLDTRTDPQATTTILGDLAPVDFDPSAAGVQSETNSLGNVITDPNSPAPEREDLLYDSAEADFIAAGGGDDVVVALRGGGDWVQGGAGRDWIQGGSGADWGFAGGGDGIHFNGFDLDDPLSTPVIGSIPFADGSSMSYADILAGEFDIEGTEGGDVLERTAVADRIMASTRTIHGGVGNGHVAAMPARPRGASHVRVA